MSNLKPSIDVLDTDREERLQLSLEKVGKTKDELQENIDIIKNWLKTQKHLPEIADNGLIANFLFMNKFSIENAKQKIDMYYTIRTLVPELFTNSNPKLPHMQKLWDHTIAVTFPRMTDDGCRVTYLKYLDTATDIDPLTFFAHSYNIIEIRLHEDIGLGDIAIYDLEHLQISQAVKYTPTVLKKLAVVFEKVYNSKVNQMHYLNTKPFLDSIMSVLKHLLKPKLFDRIHIHPTIDTLKDFIPLRVLPKDFGGEEMSLKELSAIWKQKVEKYQSRFDMLDEMKVNEELRPTPLINDDILGFHGNFKKLNVD